MGEYIVLPYDNDVTLLYKYAHYREVPAKLVFSKGIKDDGSPNFTTLYEYILTFLMDKENYIKKIGEYKNEINAAYQYVKKMSKGSINYQDFRMGFFDFYYNNVEQGETINKKTYEIINVISEEMGEEPVVRHDSNKQLIKLYDDLQHQLDDEKEQEKNMYSSTEKIHTEFENIIEEGNLPEISPVNITASITSFFPKINGETPKISDGIEIFNDAVTTRYSPFIKYNDNDKKSYYKVYTGPRREESPDPSMVVLPKDNSSKENTIYIVLWLGDPDDDGSKSIKNATKDSFYTIIYTLEHNYLTIESPVDNPKIVTDPKIVMKRAKINFDDSTIY